MWVGSGGRTVMKKRHIPGIEPLEVRETPDVSLGLTAAYPLTPPAGLADLAAFDPFLSRTGPSAVPGLDADALSLPALDAYFATPDDGDSVLRASEASGLEGWRFLSNYARKAIRNEELRRGRLADREDLVQQVFVEWWEQVGPRGQALAAVLNRDSPEHGVLRKTVRRVLDHARYEQTRARRMAELRDQPAPVKPEEQEWIDLRLDWEGRAGGAGPRERRLLELRRQGLTFEEIGSEMGLLKQRVCELYNAAVERLQERYGDE
jgi:DNA-directed RNA polymerase specialized sigma24 family protein